MAVTAAAPTHPAVVRTPTTRDFVRLKFRLMRNGLRGQAWRIVAFILAVLLGAWLALLAAVGFIGSGFASEPVGYLIAVIAGSALVIAWTVVPLLFFGVDETLDPARFALLPLRREVLARGMLAAAFVGVPAIATLLATSGLVGAAAIRFGPLAAVVALVGVVLGLVLGVVASRALTSAFAALLRSRRVRDLAAVIIALLASSIGPAQLLIGSTLTSSTVDQGLAVARVLAWTPFGAPYALPYDVAAGDWLGLAARLAITVVTIVVLLRWWGVTIESAMLDVTSGGGTRSRAAPTSGAVAALIPRVLRGVIRPGVFGAVVAREWRSWWRDPRRRSSLVSILMASAVVPIALNVASRSAGVSGGVDFSFATTMAGALGGLLLANQFAFDGSAHATHLMASVPGRVDLRARAVAISLVALPVQVIVVVAVTVLFGRPAQLPAGLGVLATSFGAAVGSAALISIVAPFALPENTNPFAMNSGGGSAKGLLAFVGILGTALLTAPVSTLAFLTRAAPWSPPLVLATGVAYGLVVAGLLTRLAGSMLQRRGPEILIAVTPRR